MIDDPSISKKALVWNILSNCTDERLIPNDNESNHQIEGSFVEKSADKQLSQSMMIENGEHHLGHMVDDDDSIEDEFKM